jgi:hypothetical protein
MTRTKLRERIIYLHKHLRRHSLGGRAFSGNIAGNLLKLRKCTSSGEISDKIEFDVDCENPRPNEKKLTRQETLLKAYSGLL